MFCPNCGTHMSDDLKFCTMCGFQLPAAVTADAAPAPSGDAPTMLFTLSGGAEPAAAGPAMTAEVSQPPVQQPQYYQPVQGREVPLSYIAEPVRKKSLAKIIIFSLLFGLFILVFGSATATTGVARDVLAGHNLSEAVADSQLSEIVIGDIILDASFGDFLAEQLEDNGLDKETTEEVSKDINMFIEENIDDDTTIGELAVMLADDEDIKTKDVEKLIAASGLTRAIADVVAAYEEHLVTGEDVTCLSVSKIMKIIEKFYEEFDDRTDTHYSIDLDMIENVIEDNDDILKDIAPQKTISGISKYTSLALSPVTIILLAVFTVLFAVLVAVTSKSIPAAFVTTGVCSMLIGIAFIITTFLDKTFLKLVGLEYDVINTFVKELLDEALFSEMFRYGIIIAVAGVVSVVIGVVISVTASAIARKKALNQ